jgi:hypothetical protein
MAIPAPSFETSDVDLGSNLMNEGEFLRKTLVNQRLLAKNFCEIRDSNQSSLSPRKLNGWAFELVRREVR